MIQFQIFIGSEEVLLTTSFDETLLKIRELVLTLDNIVWDGAVLMSISLLVLTLPSAGPNELELTVPHSDVRVSVVKTALPFSKN